jgi:SPP1 gp7 family putative phage head morphogenesis protein
MGVEFSHAQRLVRTEMNRILNQATLDGIKQAGGSTYEFLAIEDSRTCKRCQKLNHKRFKLKDKKVGLNFPPIHPRCRCTIMARFEWEDEDDDKSTAPTAPPTPTQQATSTRGTQQTIEGWLNRIEAIDKAKADNLRNEPTQANAQANAAAQDAAMKQAEAIQQNAIGIQQRAIQQGKAVISEDKKGKSECPKNIPTEADFKNSKRFGHKAGKHMQELDLDPKSQEEREKYKSIINDTIKFATKIKRGFYTREEPDVLCYQKDDMVVLLKTNGAIVTAYMQKSSIKDHPALESREWYNNMKIIFESSD